MMRESNVLETCAGAIAAELTDGASRRNWPGLLENRRKDGRRQQFARHGQLEMDSGHL